MISIVLIGTGNVARHLFDTFMKYDEIRVVQVLGRNKEGLMYFGKTSKISSNFNSVESAYIYIIAVSDDAVKTVSQQLNINKGIVVHTSGSVSIEALSKHPSRGVFYPLQTFSKERRIDFKSIPICLEASREEDLELLKSLANIISERVYEISSEQRTSLHLAAVFVNNFTNHLYQIGNEICEKNKVHFEILKPLIQETASKVETLSPFEAQTGPARRGDDSTVNKHLEELVNTDHRGIYSLMSQSIEKEYQK